jgi:hypothetical protein
MLGTLAFQDADGAYIETIRGAVGLEALSKDIADAAVDVFVYDTRKDSDGGAWRKRTQHTSWYNETLNTATRGSRRDFPAIAVIVAQSDKVTIYDADDPDMPMWMVFNTTNGSMLRSGQITSILMLNAELWVGHISGSGVHWINFLKDTARWLTASSSYGGFFIKRDISRRNESGSNYYNNVGGASDITIAGSSIYDVAITVLPNAPIDASTGLPIPTIAVATEGGVSVIKDDGTVANLTYSSLATKTVTFDKNNGLWVCFISGSGIGWHYYTNFTTTNSLPTPAHYNSGWTSIIDMFGGVAYHGIGYNYSDFSAGTLALNNFAGFGAIKASTTMSNFITTSYNTGWMHGDIKGAWLSDTSTASVTGTELVTNGNFSTSDLSAWTTIAGGTATVTGGLLKLTDTEGAFCYASAPFATVIGKQYVVSVDIVNNSNTAGSHYIRIGHSHNGTQNHDVHYGSSYGTKIIYFTATATTTYLTLISGLGVGTFGHWDNVSVRLAEADRSVNNKGLAVYGTITKTPVATGSNLVAYSGWSNSNYSLRPAGVTDLNNSSMTFMGWYKSGAYVGEETIISTGDYNTISEVRAVYLTGSGVPGFSGWANDFNPGNSIRDNQWHFVCVVVQYISGTTYNISVYVDGIITGTTSRSLLTFTNTAIDVGGGSVPGTRYINGSIALVRVSTTTPSPEQIKKIYEDEKVLFQSNSQATLFGSSDIVTALAYDDTTSLLHVGTSSGRSEFKGLVRVGNTTTAVTTSISASNGLVAEQ